MEVPQGEGREAQQRRKEIISGVYSRLYKQMGSDPKVYNRDLGEYIHIDFQSVNETKYHASRSYLSTLAVLQLESVLATAKRHGKPLAPKPGTKNQKRFTSMLDMRCRLPGIGTVKLTVGVRRGSGQKTQYCLTALQPRT